MKKIIIYLLIFFVSFAYNHETIEFFAQTVGTTLIAIIDDLDEEETESKESKESKEKSKFSDDPFLSHAMISEDLQTGRPAYKQHINFFPSEYSQVVYSPPDQA